MSAHMTNINNDTSNTNNTNNTNNQDRLDLSGGNVEHVAREDQATQRHSASSTQVTTGASSSRPMSNADHVRALAHDQKDESMVHPDEDLILSSDRVSAACLAVAITQTRQITSSLAGIFRRMVRPWSRLSWQTHRLVLPALLTT